MLGAFVVENRSEIIARCHARDDAPAAHTVEADGIPPFLDQLVAALAGGRDGLAIGAAAVLHGAELLRTGASVGQVVHRYGNACQSITELAIERGLAITTQDFKVLNRCLDDAIADAVTEYTRQRELEVAAVTARRELQGVGEFGHELRNLLAVSTLAFEALRSGSVGIAGTTGSMLGRSLVSLNVLVDRALAAIRLDTA
ncbi:MAG: sensor histidine kinase, partial [Kofleriaceae bacterium]